MSPHAHERYPGDDCSNDAADEKLDAESFVAPGESHER